MELVTELWQASGAKVEKDNILQKKIIRISKRRTNIKLNLAKGNFPLRGLLFASNQNIR